MQAVLQHFRPGIHVESLEPFGEGHINDTFLARLGHEELVLQRVNDRVFRDPIGLMENVVAVTAHLRAKAVAAEQDPRRATLTFLPTVAGHFLHHTEAGEWWRACLRVPGTRTCERAETVEQIACGSRAFGRFQRLMADFPAERLQETIPFFHHTPRRLGAFHAAVAEDRAGRAASVGEAIRFVLGHQERAGRVVEGLEARDLPLRVTHNDTKFNNVLLEADSDEAVCVIDLDTVMPGSALYDFGDSIRGGASTAAEDEQDLRRVELDVEAFQAFACGYLEEAADFLTPLEVELMPFSAWLMTFECGVRFLTDHLNGDTYFKIHREGHNLDRALNQFRLAADIQAREEDLKAIVQRALGVKA